MIPVSGEVLIWPHWKFRFHTLFLKALHIFAITHVTCHQNLYTALTCIAITLSVGNTGKLVDFTVTMITWHDEKPKLFIGQFHLAFGLGYCLYHTCQTHTHFSANFCNLTLWSMLQHHKMKEEPDVILKIYLCTA